MRNRSFAALLTLVVLVAIGAAWPITISAEDAKAVGPAPITVEGKATVYGKWTCTGPVNNKVVPGQAAEAVPGFATGIQSLTATVTIQALSCGGGNTMNGHMRKALKETEFPEIKYQADKYTLVDGGAGAQVSGQLTIAGVTRPVTIDAKLAPAPGGVHVTGKVDIAMPDYNVKPPSLMLGTMKVAPNVTVTFDTVVRAAEAGALTQ